MNEPLKCPFPWFGGKSRVAGVAWERFGAVVNFVSPFYGSGAELLGRPRPFRGTETVNDLDGYITNFWRAIAHDPEGVARWADQPVHELDLHARHDWLVARKKGFTEELRCDPDFFDAKVAGWWVWGISCWIGGNWCDDSKPSMRRQIPNVDGRGGKGVTARQIPHFRNSAGASGQGAATRRARPHLGSDGVGVHSKRSLVPWFAALQDRLRNVRVCCGDWSRICGPTPTWKGGLTAVFLDPPYGEDRDKVYAVDSATVAQDVAAWCRENQDNPLMRIALCGHEGDYDLPGWSLYFWKANGGMGNMANGRGKKNADRECIWFSPHCLAGRQGSLF